MGKVIGKRGPITHQKNTEKHEMKFSFYLLCGEVVYD